MSRREYLVLKLVVNGIRIRKVIIDDHVNKHSDHIDDALILKIVVVLDGQDFKPVSCNESYQYFVTQISFEQKWFKLVWLLEIKTHNIGVITLFRDRRIK